MQCIFNASFLLFHFDFSCSTNLDDSNTTGELGNALLQLFFVVVRRRILNLAANLLNAAMNIFTLASTIDDRGVFLGDLDLLGLTKIIQRSLLERQTNFFGDDLATGQDCDVLQHSLATVTEARCLNSCNLDDATNVINDQRRQRFTFNVFSDDDERTTRLGNGLQDR